MGHQADERGSHEGMHGEVYFQKTVGLVMMIEIHDKECEFS